MNTKKKHDIWCAANINNFGVKCRLIPVIDQYILHRYVVEIHDNIFICSIIIIETLIFNRSIPSYLPCFIN